MRLKSIIPLLIVVLSLLPGTSYATSHKSTSRQLNSDATDHAFFVQAARAAARPASGIDLYENIHEYMWREVYMIATVDYAEITPRLKRSLAFVRTWHGQAHLPELSSDFYLNPSPKFGLRKTAIVGDVVLTVPPFTELPNIGFEFIGIVCGIYQVTQDGKPLQSLPQICIPHSDSPLIRPIPLQSIQINP